MRLLPLLPLILAERPVPYGSRLRLRHTKGLSAQMERYKPCTSPLWLAACVRTSPLAVCIAERARIIQASMFSAPLFALDPWKSSRTQVRLCDVLGICLEVTPFASSFDEHAASRYFHDLATLRATSSVDEPRSAMSSAFTRHCLLSWCGLRALPTRSGYSNSRHAARTRRYRCSQSPSFDMASVLA